MSISEEDVGGGFSLADLPLFQLMPEDVRRLVAASFERLSFPFGSEIVREGDEPDGFYVLVTGRARILKKGINGEDVSLRMLTSGATFGEAALLSGSPRVATVRASSPVEVLKLERSVFRALVQTHPEVRESFVHHVTRNELYNFFRLQSAFSRLPPESLALMLGELERVVFDSGEIVIRQGERGDSMFIVEEGRLRASRDAEGRLRDLAFYRTGDFFGERALFTGTSRAATVECVTRCRLLRLTEETFKTLLDGNPEFRAAIEQRVSQYDFERVARVPLDFPDELLPADVTACERIELPQLDAAEASVPAEGDVERVTADWSHGGAKRIRRFPHVWQIDEMDCGAACLAMAARHYGRAVSLTHIRPLVHTGTDGTSLLGIVHGAQELGLAARSVKVSASALADIVLPAIVHWEANHWVVLYAVGEKHVRIADPARGLRRIPREEFEQKWSGFVALLAYREAFESAPEGRPTMRWVWPFLLPYKSTIAKAVVLALVAAALQMALPVFTQIVVDDVLDTRDFGLLNLIILGMVAVLVLMIGATLVQRYILSRAAVRIDGATLDFLTDKLLALPMAYFNSRRTGDIQRRLAGMRQVREFLVQNGVQALTASAQLLAALALMLFYSWLLAFVFLATLPAYVALMRLSARRLRPMFDSLEEAFGKYQSRQIDAVKGIETVKAMGAEAGLRRVMLRQFDELAQRVFKADFAIMAYEGLVQLATFASLTLFLWVGALQVLNGNLTVGELVAFNSLVVLANQPIVLLLSSWDQLQFSSILLNRLNDILDQEPEQGEDRSHLRSVRSLEGRIAFRSVGFQYRGPVPVPILEGISFDVPPGTRVAIVGRSGSGKTTLVKCLAGLLEPSEGAILYDGVELGALDYRSLRRKIGFVLQDNYLFDDTIARNIAFGEDEPDLDVVAWAARTANADGFVERLPLAYETKIGETGILLSGGQRQRIAIARALYHRPPVLVFDEATSSLDTESERAVKERMDELFEGRTSFVIAHRLSTIRDADLILVLEQGRLVEQGTHEELMQRQGLYYYLSSQQLEL